MIDGIGSTVYHESNINLVLSPSSVCCHELWLMTIMKSKCW